MIQIYILYIRGQPIGSLRNQKKNTHQYISEIRTNKTKKIKRINVIYVIYASACYNDVQVKK